MVALRDVIRIERRSASADESRLLPYVGLEHIEKDTGAFAEDFTRTPETLLATKFLFTPRHVLYGKLRPYLNKVALPDFAGVCTTEIWPLLPKESCLDRQYLYYLLLTRHFVSWASNRVQGANLPRLSPDDLLEYEIDPLPPLPEQQRIARLLHRADRLRRLRRYALALSDTFLPAVFRQMFGDPKTNPHEWLKSNIQDIAIQVTDGEHQTPRRVNAGIKLLSARNIQNGLIDLEAGLDFIPPDEYERIKKRCCPTPGDVLMSCSGTVGRVATVALREPFALVIEPNTTWRSCYQT